MHEPRNNDVKRSNQSFEERHQLAHVKTDGKDGRQMSRRGEQAREERQSVIPHLLDCLPETLYYSLCCGEFVMLTF